jgi:hypothetical protein
VRRRWYLQDGSRPARCEPKARWRSGLPREQCDRAGRLPGPAHGRAVPPRHRPVPAAWPGASRRAGPADGAAGAPAGTRPACHHGMRRPNVGTPAVARDDRGGRAPLHRRGVHLYRPCGAPCPLEQRRADPCRRSSGWRKATATMRRYQQDPDADFTADALRSWISDRTSSVMLPRRVVYRARRADGVVVLTGGLLKDTVMSTRKASGRAHRSTTPRHETPCDRRHTDVLTKILTSRLGKNFGLLPNPQVTRYTRWGERGDSNPRHPGPQSRAPMRTAHGPAQ